LFSSPLLVMLICMSLQRQIFVLLVGAFVGLGISLSAIQAGEMTTKMSAMSGMDGSAKCNDCGDNGPSKAMTACSFGCVTPVFAMLPQVTPAKILPASTPLVRQHSLLRGGTFSPDPDPPRSNNLG
jgi:hypothetical protein